MKPHWILSLLLSSGLWAADQVPPGPELIEQALRRMGSEDYAVRTKAKAQVQAWSDQYPRQVLTRLAEAYRRQSDLEIEFQLAEILRDLGGRVMFYQPKAFLGVNFELSQLPDGRKAIYLQTVIEGSPADQAGLRSGDFLLEVGETRVESYEDSYSFAEQIQQLLPLEPLRLRVLRQKKEFRVEVILSVKEEMASYLNSRAREEEAKIELWLKALRSAPEDSGDEPAGPFRMD